MKKILFGLYLFLTLTLLLKEPAVWPDEAIFADVAFNLAHKNLLGTQLLKGLILQVETHALWYPPTFFMLLTFWLKIFGFTIVAQRLFSVFVGFLVLGILSFMIKELKVANSEKITFLTLLLTTLDITFLKASRVSRPEILILLLGFSAFLFYLKPLKNGLNFLLAGFFVGLAVLTQIIGLFVPLAIGAALILQNKLKLFFQKKFYYLILPPIVLVSGWLLTLADSFKIFKTQVFLAIERKQMETPFILQVFPSQPWELKILYLVYLLSTLTFAYYVWQKRNPQLIFLLTVLISSWLLSISGREFWYLVYPLPFVYLGLAIVNSYEKEKRSRLYQLSLLFITTTLFINSFLNLKLLYSLGGEKYSYEKFTQAILKVLPEKGTIFLSSIPDPYFALKKEKNLTLYEFPVFKIPQENYQKVLEASDWVVFNGEYDAVVFGDYLIRYLEKNAAKVYKVGEKNQYQALIIELKPLSERRGF